MRRTTLPTACASSTTETLLVHLSGEDGKGWTVIAVDRDTRRWAIAQAVRQRDAAERAHSALYPA